MTIREYKNQIIKNISSSPSPQLDAEVLLCHFLNYNKTQLLMHQNETLPEEIKTKLDDATTRRASGLPIAYITGHKEFYGYDFIVTPDVLIPKPDTEGSLINMLILTLTFVGFFNPKLIVNFPSESRELVSSTFE